MGAYLSEPMTNKESEDGEGNRLKFGACSMQGWRVSQEDAHNCIASFDEKSSLFAVYDGHGGAEVAIYLSRHLPEILKTCEAYKNGEFIKALEECYLKIDAGMKSPEVIKEIQLLAKRNNGDNEAQADYEEDDVGALYEEATMPLDKLVAKYQPGSTEESKDEAEADAECKPGSSKSISAGPSPSKLNKSEAASSSSLASSAVCSSSSASSSEANLNGGAEESSTSGPADSSSSSANPVPSKTEVDQSSAAVDSSCELIVQGKKIELLGKNTKDEGLNNEADSSDSNNSHPGKVNGTVSENGDNAVESEKPEVDTSESSSAALNGNSSKVSSSENDSEVTASKENEVSGSGSGEATPETTPRRKKVHPTPIAKESVPERRSPRKNQREPGFELLDSEDSDDDDEDDDGRAFKMGDSDSDDDEGEEEETSNDEDDDDDDDYEDEDEEEDERFLSDIQEPGYDSGSTAVVGFMKWEADGLSLWVANAGDSRCVVCREGKAIDMSHDHKPELDVEAQRIVKAGGKVTEDGRVNGGLNLSRALGDHSYKQNTELPPEEQMISPLPAIEHIVLNPAKDKFLVLACDGIWNSMSSQEVVDFVGQRLDDRKPLSKICEELFDTCLASDTCGDGTGCDNMTAIIVQLQDGQIFSGSKRRFSGDAETEDSDSKKAKTDGD